MNTLTPLRIGVVGIGARSNIARHAELPQCGGVVVAACDPAPITPEDFRKRTGLDPAPVTITRTLEEFIALGVDAAIVTTTDDTHAEVAVPLLRAGIPVYLEKPLAIHQDDADVILQTAYETGTRLYVGHNMRHMGVVTTLRDLIRQGTIGEVKAIWCRHFVGHGGDFYFHDWHADRRHVNGLLLQKAAHDLDVMHWLAGSHTTRVVGMGDLMVYGRITDRREHVGEVMQDWFSHDNWPPLAQTGLNPIIDVEDLSMMLGRLESGAMISYQQCHFTPDYWRNYTVIGTEGRLENFGDGEGGHIRLWNRRSGYDPEGAATFPITGDAGGHGDADVLTMTEFLEFVRTGAPTDTSPLGAWYAVAAAIQATESLRDASTPRDIPELPTDIVDYFNNNQVK